MTKKTVLIPLASLAAAGIVVLATQITPPMAPPVQQLSCERPTVTHVAPTPPPPPKPTTIPMRPTMPRPQSSD